MASTPKRSLQVPRDNRICERPLALLLLPGYALRVVEGVVAQS